MKRINFLANEADQARLADLMKKLGVGLTAILREAIRLLHKKEITQVNKVLLVVALTCFAIACGGQRSRLPQDGSGPIPTPTPTPSATPLQVPITITSAQVFSVSMIGQAWQFEGSCGGDVLDPAGHVMVSYPQQVFHATILITPSPGLTFTKDADCGYWSLGNKDAALYDFALELDDGGWYNTGGHVVLPFGCPWCLPTPSTPQDYTYTVPPPADPSLPRAYLIVPPTGNTRDRILLDTEYGTVHWQTIAYVEQVATPVYSGPALVSEQLENNCVHEYWYLAPGLGIVQIKSVPIAGCSGLQTTVIMKRTM